jgi:hypothetical protein
MVTRCQFRKVPGFRLLSLLVEVTICTPWIFAEQEAWVQHTLKIWSFVGREPWGKSVWWEPGVKSGFSRMPSGMAVTVLGSHCGP